MLAILANGPHHGRRLEVPAEHDYVALPTTDDPASTTAAIYRKHGPGLAPGDVDLRCSKGASPGERRAGLARERPRSTSSTSGRRVRASASAAAGTEAELGIGPAGDTWRTRKPLL